MIIWANIIGWKLPNQMHQYICKFPMIRTYKRSSSPVLLLWVRICFGWIPLAGSLMAICKNDKENEIAWTTMWVHIKSCLFFFFPFFSQIGTYLRSWARPALQNQYGRHFHFTELWNRTMTKVNQGLIEEHILLWPAHDWGASAKRLSAQRRIVNTSQLSVIFVPL